MSTAIAFLGGATMGAGAYALEGPLGKRDMQPWMKGAIVAGVGLGLGALVSTFNKAAGAGVAGGGGAVAAYEVIKIQMQKQSEGLGQIPGYAYRKFGHTSAQPGYYHLPNPAEYAQLNAVGAELGAMQAQLDAVGAELQY
jgi:hypothetical protein